MTKLRPDPLQWVCERFKYRHKDVVNSFPRAVNRLWCAEITIFKTLYSVKLRRYGTMNTMGASWSEGYMKSSVISADITPDDPPLLSIFLKNKGGSSGDFYSRKVGHPKINRHLRRDLHPKTALRGFQGASRANSMFVICSILLKI